MMGSCFWRAGEVLPNLVLHYKLSVSDITLLL